MPSIERTVLVGASSVRDVIAWTTASDPARVDNTYWWGLHALWNVWAWCWIKLRATTRGEHRRRQCPRPDHFVLTRPLTAPAALIAGGMFACANRVATATKLFVMFSSCKISLKVSAVRPEGLGAAPLPARRTLARRVAAGRLVGLAGWNWRTCSGIGWYGWAGRRAGSRTSC